MIGRCGHGPARALLTPMFKALPALAVLALAGCSGQAPVQIEAEPSQAADVQGAPEDQVLASLPTSYRAFPVAATDTTVRLCLTALARPATFGPFAPTAAKACTDPEPIGSPSGGDAADEGLLAVLNAGPSQVDTGAFWGSGASAVDTQGFVDLAGAVATGVRCRFISSTATPTTFGFVASCDVIGRRP